MDIGSLTGAIELEDHLSRPLELAADRIKEFAHDFDGMAKGVLVGAGVITAAIGGTIAAVVALGEKGSTILGVEESFNRLAEAAGSTGEALSGALSEGVRGTVDSFELMQSTTKLLSSNVKLTADDMKVMASTAREMGKSTGTDATVGLNQLSQALLTGSTRTLKLHGITIDTVQAEKDFAKAHGVLRDQLSASGVIESHRVAILEAMRTKLDTLGESQLSFKERIQQANVTLGNWFDNLAKGVAKSAAVNAAFDTISASIKETFGDTSQAILQNLLKWVDQFASAVSRLGPTVIQTIGGIKDRIVAVWNEVVAFNERWQITNNLIAGAKFAWSVLEGAFRLVEKAVQAVIVAWSSMPEWLRRITVASLQGAAAVSAFSVGVAGVAVPFAALVSKFDLGLNIISNTAVSIGAVTSVWPKLINAYKLAHTAIGVYIIDLRMSAIGSQIEMFATGGVAAAKMTLAAATNVATLGFSKLSAALGLSTAATYVETAATTVAKTAQAAWAIAVAFTSTMYTGLITRLGLATTALRINTIAIWAAKGVMELFGFVLLGIQAIPLVAALTALGFALHEVWIGFKNLQKAWEEGKSTWDFLTAKDNDNWLRRWLGLSTAIDGTAEALKRLHKGGTFGETPTIPPQLVPGALAPGSTEMQDARAERERLERRAAGIGLVNDSFVQGSTIADDYAKKVRDLVKSFESIGVVGSEVDVFTAAFARLTPELLKNADVQRALAPEIDKLANAHGILTPKMMAVRDAAMATRIAYQEKDAATLASAGVTQGLIDQLKQQGLTEEDIARSYGVSTEALTRRTVAMQEAAQIAQNLQSFEAAFAAQEAATTKRREDAALRANKAIADSQEALDDLIRKDTLSTTNYQIDQIERETAARIAEFSLSGATADQIKAFNDLQISLSRHRVGALRVDNEALKAHSRSTLQDIADNAKATYEAMKANPQEYSRATILEFKRIADEAKKAADVTRTVWNDVWDNIKDVIKSIPDIVSQAFTGGGGMSGALKALGAQLSKAIMEPLMKRFEAFATRAQQIALGLSSGVASLIGGAVGGGTGASIGGMAASMTMMAAQSGMLGTTLAGSALAAGALSLGIGAAAVGVYALVKHFATVSKEVKETRTAVADFEKELHGTLTQQQLIESGGVEWKETVIAVRDAYVLVGKTVADAENIVSALWDTGHPARARAAADEIAINVALAQNIRSVRSMVQEYVGAGTKIPAALQANIDKLVIMGRLTADNAAQMLNLVTTSVPSYGEVQSAAERYGIVVETLGNAVQGLKVTEIANQMVTDWGTMEAAGADMNVVMAGMRDEVLKLITDATKFGTALPAAMKPIIERMDAAGEFTDEFGNKLVDVSNLTFAETLVDKIDKLVTAMMDLVTAITDGVGGALDDLGNKVVHPRIEPIVVGDRSHYSGGGVGDYTDPLYAASGATVRGNVVPFRPRGTDTIPAMVTPGERILSVAEAREYDEGGGGTAILEVDGRILAEIVVPKLRKVTKRYGLSRR